MAKILIIEDDPIIAEDLRMILQNEGYQIAGIANNATTANDMLYSRQADIVLLDISLEGHISGIEIAKIINQKYQIPFIYITSFTDDYTLELVNGTLPSGFISKPFKKRDILANIKISLNRKSSSNESFIMSLADLNKNNNCKLTPHEYEIVIAIYQGLSNADICEKYNVTINTTKTHIKRIFKKLNISSRTQVAKILTS